MSHTESLTAPVSPRIGSRDDAAPSAHPVSFRPAPGKSPGQTGFSFRGTLLYPAILTALAFAAHLVGGKKDGLR